MNKEKFLSVLLSAYACNAPKRTSYFDGIQNVSPSLRRRANSEVGQAAFDRHRDNIASIAGIIRASYRSPETENPSASGTPSGLIRD